MSRCTHVASQGYKLWLLKTIDQTWRLFAEEFVSLWDRNWGAGDAYKKEVYNTKELQTRAQKAYMSEIFQDSLGYAAAKMIRCTIVHTSMQANFYSSLD
jgi:5-methylthioribose kinase